MHESRQRRWQKKRTAEGKCMSCGKVLDGKSRWRCKLCTIKIREYARNYHDRQHRYLNSRSYREALCPGCGMPPKGEFIVLDGKMWHVACLAKKKGG